MLPESDGPRFLLKNPLNLMALPRRFAPGSPLRGFSNTFSEMRKSHGSGRFALISEALQKELWPDAKTPGSGHNAFAGRKTWKNAKRGVMAIFGTGGQKIFQGGACL
ncbi:hypothetical protein [Desulfonema ishimotonii]|uniref:hypothetical protein n=1 Tax=Desulfonema ishimotonii TaxID=45657 RepID=UPI00140CB3DA|nr:hypothetical protein [Desulfonema ishimotonii]